MASSDRPAPDARLLLVAVVALAFLMNTIGRGVTETFAVFLLPVERSLGVSRSEITLTYSIYMLVHGLAAPFAGQLIDRLGARAAYGAGLALLGAGYVLAGATSELWHYYITVGVLGGLGASCLGMVAASSLLSRWFSRRLGSIMSLPYAAIGFGMLVIPPATQLLLQHMAWREAHRAIGLAILALLPLIVALPLGTITAGSAEWRAEHNIAREQRAGQWTLRDALRTRAFWGLAAAYFGTSVAAYSVLPQSVAYLVEHGFSPILAASAFGMTGMLSAAGILAMGWLSDRIGRLPAVTISYVFSMLGTLSLLAVAWQPSVLFLYGFVAMFGIMQGVRGPMIVALVATLYRGGAVGSIFGAMSLALGAGAALGSWGSGLLRDLTGGYTASFALAIAGSALGLAMFWGVGSIRTERIEPGGGER
jgi:MFS family permease